MTQVSQVGWGMPTMPGHVFRGQSDSEWALEPGLARSLRGVTQRAAALQLEQRLEREFFAQAHLVSHPGDLLTVQSNNWFDRLALMQHHGVPTRLLDWTTSPMVAAYFACVDNLANDGAIFVASAVRINQRFMERVTAMGDLGEQVFQIASNENMVQLFMPERRSERVVTQQGHFSAGTDLLSSHDEYLCSCLRPGVGPSGPAVIAAKWTVPADLKLRFLGHLRQMNVAGHSLFPGLDGLGKSLREAVLVERTMML